MWRVAISCKLRNKECSNPRAFGLFHLFATSRPPNSPQHMRSLKFRGDMFLRRLAKFVKSRYSFVTYPTFAYYYTATKQLY